MLPTMYFNREQKTDFNHLELGISLDGLIEWIDER